MPMNLVSGRGQGLNYDILRHSEFIFFHISYEVNKYLPVESVHATWLKMEII